MRGEADDQGCSSAVRSDALLLDAQSVADLRPSLNIGVGGAGDALTGHMATVERVADEQLLYLQSQGLTAEQAMSMIVTGFSESVTEARYARIRSRVGSLDRASDARVRGLEPGRRCHLWSRRRG